MSEEFDLMEQLLDGGGSAPNAHRLIVTEEDSIPAVVAGRTYGRMLGSGSGVDIRV